jgi:cbb3-type cytochrome oxidase subunit 3
MKQLILTQFPWTSLPIVALVIFFTFFVGLIVSVSLRSRRPVLQEASRIPLEDAPLADMSRKERS